MSLEAQQAARTEKVVMLVEELVRNSIVPRSTGPGASVMLLELQIAQGKLAAAFKGRALKGHASCYSWALRLDLLDDSLDAVPPAALPAAPLRAPLADDPFLARYGQWRGSTPTPSNFPSFFCP